VRVSLAISPCRPSDRLLRSNLNVHAISRIVFRSAERRNDHLTAQERLNLDQLNVMARDTQGLFCPDWCRGIAFVAELAACSIEKPIWAPAYVSEDALPREKPSSGRAIDAARS
jgi:hypothetical protein